MPDPADTGLSESEVQTPESSPASASVPSPAPSTSTEATPAEDGRSAHSLMREALEARAEQRSASKGDEPTEAPKDDDPSGASAQPETAEASKPDAVQPNGEAGKGRRARAAEASAQTIDELRAENERLRSDRQAEIDAAVRAKADAETHAATLRSETEAYEKTVSTLIGQEPEYIRRLHAPSGTLTPEQERELDDWKANRQQLAPVARFYQAQANTNAEQRVTAERERLLGWLGSAVERLAKLPGTDPTFFASEAAADPYEQGKHLHEAGARSRDAEVADLKARLAEAEANVQASSHDRLRTARTAELGGRSAGPSTQIPDDTASPREMIAFGLQQRQRQARAARSA